MKQLINFVRKSTSKNIVFLPAIGIFAVIIGFVGVQAMANSHLPKTKKCQNVCVSLTTTGMSPNELAVKIGEFVQFNSADDQMHNISMGRGEDGSKGQNHEAHNAPHEHIGDYSSGDFGADEAWRVQFKKAGTYHLHDHYHPNLQIVIVVYDSNNPTTIQ